MMQKMPRTSQDLGQLNVYDLLHQSIELLQHLYLLRAQVPDESYIFQFLFCCEAQFLVSLL